MEGPFSLLVYGKTKIGKTLDACHTFRSAHVLNCEPGGLSTVEANLGIKMDATELVDLRDPYGEVKRVIAAKAPLIQAGKLSGFILDTGSELAERMLNAAQSQAKDPRQAYQRVGFQFSELIRTLLLTRGWLVMLCHEQLAKQEDMGMRRAGPKLPGRLVENIPSMFSCVLWATIGSDANGSPARRYRCDGTDPLWIMGDRYGVAERDQPMALAPLVYRLSRPEEDMAPELYEKLVKKPVRVGGKTVLM